MANQAPEKTFRIGLCSASVFKNTIESKDGKSPKRTIRTVVLQRRYQDNDGKWQSTNSFGLAELPCVARVLDLARNYVEGVEAETSA